MDGNSLTRYPDGHWEWWEGCITKKRMSWDGSLNQQRFVNCATGLIHYKIWG